MSDTMHEIKPLMDALEAYKDHYDNDGSDYSVTGLIDHPRIVHLTKRHWKEIRDKPVIPVREIDSFAGTGLHDIFYEYLIHNPDYILERRSKSRLLDRVVSGCPDCYHKPTFAIYDYKKTKAWKKVFSDMKEYEQQLNLYAYLLKSEGIVVRKLYILAWWKDFNKRESMNNPKYPRQKVEQLPIKLWTKQQQEDFIYERLGLMMDSEDLDDQDLPECSKEDMWERTSSWAVYKLAKGKRLKKASRVLYSRKDAEKWAENMMKGLTFEIESRPGMRERCENWCSVTDYCNQYKEYMEGK